MESGRRGRLLVVGLIALGLGLAGFASWYRSTHRATPRAAPRSEREIPGERDRVVAEVLNASGTTGLARVITGRLRDAGVDVVYFGSDTASALDSTEVLVRRGSADAGERVRDALGAGRVRAAPDASRLVDVTVRLGRDLAPLLRDP